MYCVGGGKECNGCGECLPQNYKCPLCGGECEKVYFDTLGDIVGCDVCLEMRWADDLVNDENDG